MAGGRLVAVSATQATGCVRGGVRVYTKVASYRPLIDEWTRGVDTHYRDAGSILAKEPNDLVDVCSTDVRRKLEGCGVDDTGSFDGTGYNTLLQAGDMNGDGFGDLLARTSGGTLYRVPSRDFELADFDHRVRIGGGWDAYSRLVAVRDISGDGRGDLVARDGSGVLWLYRGTSDGKFAAQGRIGGGWGTYNTLAGRGDLSGDGRSDLVARDGSECCGSTGATAGAASSRARRSAVAGAGTTRSWPVATWTTTAARTSWPAPRAAPRTSTTPITPGALPRRSSSPRPA